MKLLITGARGFIARNFIETMKGLYHHELLEFSHESGLESLKRYCRECDFVFHFAGVNRPETKEEYESGNVGFTVQLLSMLQASGNACPIVFTSSVKAEEDSAYGRSKLACEKALREHGRKMGSRIYIYRLPHIFGKWARPDYNSAVATFCFQISREQDISVHDPDSALHLVHIDDAVREFYHRLEDEATGERDFCQVTPVYHRTVGELAEKLKGFFEIREGGDTPELSDAFARKLYSTYVSYCPEGDLMKPLNMHCDLRGSFTELFHMGGYGQISVNVIKPQITKGNHWHNTRHEKFLTVKGQGVIRLRRLDAAEIYTFEVSGETMNAVDIPAGYTHNIENTGLEDMVTIMWANEAFSPENPDTFYQEV